MRGDQLRDALDLGLVVAPGAHDALTARMVEQAGFPAVFVSGATLSATRLGRPDLGFLSPTDVVEATRTVAGATVQPVIVDADTGWGNAVHVAEHVQRLEAAGASAVVLEDQVAPKRCGAMTGKAVVGVEEMRSRLGAAMAARHRMLVVARTDAAGVTGLDDAAERASHYAADGVDLVFVSGVTDPATLQTIRAGTGDVPLVTNLSEAATPSAGWPAVDDLAAVGVRLAIVPVLGLLAAVAATRNALVGLRRDGTDALRAPEEWTDLTNLLGLPALLAAEQRWDASSIEIGAAGRPAAPSPDHATGEVP